MTDRRFFGMVALALFSAVAAMASAWPAAVFPTMMFLLLGFDAIAMEAAKPLRRETGSTRKGDSAVAKPIAQKDQPHD